MLWTPVIVVEKNFELRDSWQLMLLFFYVHWVNLIGNWLFYIILFRWYLSPGEYLHRHKITILNIHESFLYHVKYNLYK